MDDVRSLREYAWKHFELHANQRTLMFRFYIIFITLLMSGIGYLLLKFVNKGNNEESAALILSILLIVIAFIFKKIDLRNKTLIDDSKSTLVYLESLIQLDPVLNQADINLIRIFDKDEKRPSGCFYNHSKCFGLIFNISIGIGIIMLYLALYRMGIITNIFHRILSLSNYISQFDYLKILHLR